MYANVKHQQAFSLVELIISIVLLSIAFLLLTVTYFPTAQRSVDPILQVRASLLAQAYMEEIMAKRFDENSAIGGDPRCDEAGQSSCSSTLGPDSETRANYDDVDDFHLLSDQPPVDATGTTLSQFASYSVSVSVSYSGTDFALPSQALKKIEVTVTGPQDFTAVFASYKGNF